MKDNLLEVKNLKVYFNSIEGVTKAVDGIDFAIEKGKVLGIAGESGSGKSITSLAVMQLIPKPNGHIAGGDILFEGKSILDLDEKEMRKIRGNNIAMIFQEPMTSLNPVFTIGYQIGESLQIHQGLKGKKNREKSIEMLRMVRIPRPEKVIDEYPHQLSGGMKQRVMIAIALSCNPKLLIADEPTTALDVTIQAQILQIMKELTKKMDTSIMFITHDLGVIAEMADDVAVMYCGKIVEKSSAKEILNSPLHPYTKGLIKARPDNFSDENGFYYIDGRVPSYNSMPEGCTFYPRCKYKMEICKNKMPEFKKYGDERMIRCWLYDEEYKKGNL